MNTRLDELSSIPGEADERVTEFYEGGGKKRADYFLNGESVGWRSFTEAGGLEMETAYRNGRQHGLMRRWYESGQLLSATTYVKGREHGTARQWAEDGTMVGTYEMDHGTGLDLWWDSSSEDGAWRLWEARMFKAGDRHGCEWLIDADRQSLWQEFHFANGKDHGIHRSWNDSGRLSRGYPKYFVDGEQVIKRKYLRDARTDPSLPPFREEDNRPERQFPPEVAAALRPYTKQRED